MSGKIMMDNTIHRRWGKEDEALGKEKRSPWKGKERKEEEGEGDMTRLHEYSSHDDTIARRHAPEPHTRVRHAQTAILDCIANT